MRIDCVKYVGRSKLLNIYLWSAAFLRVKITVIHHIVMYENTELQCSVFAIPISSTVNDLTENRERTFNIKSMVRTEKAVLDVISAAGLDL